MVYTYSIFTLCSSLAGRRISKDGSISCEYADLTAAVPVLGNVQCELILLPAASFHLRTIVMSCYENTETKKEQDFKKLRT